MTAVDTSELRDPRDLLGLSDIGKMVGISRQRVHKLANDSEAFPPPEEIVGSKIRVWRREVIEEWAAATGRKVREEERPHVHGAPLAGGTVIRGA